MSNKNNYEVVAKGVQAGGVIMRLFGYMTFYVPIAIVLFFIAAIGGAKDIVRLFGIPDTDLAISLVLFGGLAVPFILWEVVILRYRKKNGLSLWKNIEEDLLQMAVNERVGREQKAYAKIDKSNIGYWHELKEKGAITETEYAAKKKELLTSN